MGEPLGLVYLVWGPLGTRPLRDFLSAYTRCAAGTDHELIVAFNGVLGSDERGPAAGVRSELMRELEGVEHRLLELEQPVLDLAAYLEIARLVEHPRLCFLNSHSEPLVDGWLALLSRAAAAPDVGAVGATGSWASQASHVRYLIGLGGPYAWVYPDRERTRRVFAPPSTPGVGAADRVERGSRATRLAREKLHAARLLGRQLVGFPPFPAPHLRSNAFLLERGLLRELETGPLTDKTDTYLLESGRRSFTRQIEGKGLRVLVVGRDGVAYGPREWALSHVFWQGSQENLIIADNQTRSYEHANLEVRRLLSAHAWGESAAPAEPDGAPGETLASYGGPVPESG